MRAHKSARESEQQAIERKRRRARSRKMAPTGAAPQPVNQADGTAESDFVDVSQPSADKKSQKLGDQLTTFVEEAREKLDEREKALDEKERELKRAKMRAEEVEKRMMGDRGPKDIIRVNVGGTLFAVLRQTLCQYEDSYMGAYFSGLDRLLPFMAFGLIC